MFTLWKYSAIYRNSVKILFSSMIRRHYGTQGVKKLEPRLYYEPDPREFISLLTSKRLNIVAYRITKDYIHYVRTEILDGKTINVIDGQGFYLPPMFEAVMGEFEAKSKIEMDSLDADQLENTEGDLSGNQSEKKKKKKKTKRQTGLDNFDIVELPVANSIVAQIVQESPVADAYVIERPSSWLFPLTDKPMRIIYKNFMRYKEVLFSHLTAKWRSINGIGNENPDVSSTIYPIFESNTTLVDELFQLRRSRTMCESMVNVINSLPNGYSSVNGLITAGLSTNIEEHLRHRSKKDPEQMELHLLCAAILESVSFAHHILSIRNIQPGVSLENTADMKRENFDK